MRPPRLQQKGPLLKNAQELLDELRKRQVTIPAFATEHNLSRQSVEKVLSGGMKRISLELALSISSAAKAIGVDLPVDGWRVTAPVPKKTGSARRRA